MPDRDDQYISNLVCSGKRFGNGRPPPHFSYIIYKIMEMINLILCILFWIFFCMWRGFVLKNRAYPEWFLPLLKVWHINIHNDRKKLFRKG